jgi:hypothetical protein
MTEAPGEIATEMVATVAMGEARAAARLAEQTRIPAAIGFATSVATGISKDERSASNARLRGRGIRNLMWIHGQIEKES